MDGDDSVMNLGELDELEDVGIDISPSSDVSSSPTPYYQDLTIEKGPATPASSGPVDWAKIIGSIGSTAAGIIAATRKTPVTKPTPPPLPITAVPTPSWTKYIPYVALAGVGGLILFMLLKKKPGGKSR